MRYFDTFSGIGGFPLGIQLAYESLCDADGGEVGGSQSNTQSDQGQGLLTKEGQDTRTKERPVSERITNRIDERPLCIGYSEIDSYASAIYQKHFPYEQCERCRTKNEGQRVQGVRSEEGFNSERNNISTIGLTCSCKHKPYGDITKIIAEDLPDFDLLVGGFPCQAFSIAGKRGGFEDTRGTMFFELARILRAKQPRLFVFENVKGLLSHDGGKSFATIIQTLDELGYDCQWQVLNSKNHGVPQNRERVFIIGHLRGTSRPEVFPFGETSEEDTRNVGEDLSYALDASYAKGTNTLEKGRRQLIQLNNPTHSNDRVYGADGISPTLNTMQGGNRQPFIKIPEATKRGYAEATIGDSINLSVPDSKTRRGRVGVGVANTLDTGMQQYTIQPTVNVDTGPIWSTFPEEMKIRRLTPTECERLQGFPDGWTQGISDTQRYKCCGNAVTVNVIRDIFKKLLN
jgi:DNA (cytosine-5)-methyltransferase 1